MPRIPEIANEQASEPILALYQAAEAQMGLIPNVFRAMAHSQAVLSTFMKMQETLSTVSIDAHFRQQIAVLVAEFDRSPYCLAVNTAIGLHAGLSSEELLQARQSQAADEKRQTALEFVTELMLGRGVVSDEAFAKLTDAGYTYQQISEILAHVGFNLFANYFNLAAQTTPDFPAVSLDPEKAIGTIHAR